MKLGEWHAVEKRIDAAQVPDGPALLDRLSADFVAGLDPLECLSLKYDPRAYLRPRQLPPPDVDWLTWILVCGRAWGKSHAAAAWIVSEIMTCTPARPAEYVLVAPTEEDCIRLQWAAIARLLPPWIRAVPRLSHQEILIPDKGVRLILWSAAKPEARGLNARGAWLDEIVAYPAGGKTLYRNLRRALRAPGPTPARCVVTTTPPETLDHFLLDLCAQPTTRVTRGTARDALRYSGRFVDRVAIEAWYSENTAESRRENDGEFVFGVDGALFTIDDIERDRVTPEGVPRLDSLVVAIDPAMSDGADADNVGCAVLGFAGGHGYLLASFSERLSPADWPRRALELGTEHRAASYVVEATGAGQTAKTLLVQQARIDNVNVRNVIDAKAKGSKAFRLGPVANAAKNGRLHVVGHQADFEREATTWHPGARFSPGALDALAHAWGVVTNNGGWI